MAVLLLLATAGAADDVAFVVGIGTASFREETGNGIDGQEHPMWRRSEHLAAREEAEQAFRDLVRAAAAGPLYAVGPIWYDDGAGQFNPAVLLTDGTTDNRAIPSVPVMRRMSVTAFEGLQPGDDAVAFLAGPGHAAAGASWVYGRRGERYRLEELAEQMFTHPGNGTRVLVARIFPGERGKDTSTVCLADAASARRLQAWSATASAQALAGREVEPPGRLLPGLSTRLAGAAPTRFARLGGVLQSAVTNGEAVVTIDFADAVEPREQHVEVPVELHQQTLFETNRVRRPGPLFTIVEEEIVKEIGSETRVDAAALEDALAAHRLPPASVRGLADHVRRGATSSFVSTNRIGVTDYVVAFDREQRRVAVVYYD